MSLELKTKQLGIFPIRYKFNRMLELAQSVIAGPEKLQTDDFWGWANLSLQSGKVPKIRGSIESRIVYASPDFSNQTKGILRQVIWDAREANLTYRKQILNNKDFASDILNFHQRCVWVELEWLLMLIKKIERLEVDLNTLRINSNHEEFRRLKVEKSDGVVFELSWGEESTMNKLRKLSEVWKIIWKDMDVFLESGIQVDPEEKWELGLSLIQSYVDLDPGAEG